MFPVNSRWRHRPSTGLRRPDQVYLISHCDINARRPMIILRRRKRQFVDSILLKNLAKNDLAIPDYVAVQLSAVATRKEVEVSDSDRLAIAL